MIIEREALERGFSGSLLIVRGRARRCSLGAAFLRRCSLPKEPPSRSLDGFAVPLPRGGGGTPNPAPRRRPRPRRSRAAARARAPEPEPPPQDR